MLPLPHQHLINSHVTVSFQDESREIASDYAGGAARYAAFPGESGSPKTRRTPDSISSSSSTITSVTPTHPTLPPILPLLPLSTTEATSSFKDYPPKKHRTPDSFVSSTVSQVPSLTSTTMPISTSHMLTTPHKQPARDFLDSQEKTLFMQVFVEEVGLWMDSLDPQKHVRTFILELSPL